MWGTVSSPVLLREDVFSENYTLPPRFCQPRHWSCWRKPSDRDVSIVQGTEQSPMALLFVNPLLFDLDDEGLYLGSAKPPDAQLAGSKLWFPSFLPCHGWGWMAAEGDGAGRSG